MKFRTFLMFVCMIVVPMIAMFSHKVPTAMRTACGELLIAPINYFAEIIFHPSVASSTDQEIAVFDTTSDVPLLAHQHNHLDISDNQNTSAESALPHQPQYPTAMETPASAYRDQLIAAGAHRLLVEPATDSSGGYHGSCRVSVDAQGELQRLFHARASTKSATLEKLLQQVRHWQQRVSVHITAKSMETLSYQ